MASEELRRIGVSPVCLLTDHIGFYERYGWEFLRMVQGDGDVYLQVVGADRKNDKEEGS